VSVVPVQRERLDDLKALHEAGMVATHGVFACITDEGTTALEQKADQVVDANKVI
jgi:hypothetical protein